MLKPFGYICKVDKLGRIVVPVKIRKMFDLSEDSPLELFVDEDKIVLKRYLPQCCFCKGTEELSEIKGNYICRECLKEISNL